MSSRQVRKLQQIVEKANLKNKESGSDDDFEPLYMNKPKTSYNWLTPGGSLAPQFSGDDDDDEDEAKKEDEEEEEEGEQEQEKEDTSDDPPKPAITKKWNKKKEKKKNKKRKLALESSLTPELSAEDDEDVKEEDTSDGTSECETRQRTVTTKKSIKKDQKKKNKKQFTMDEVEQALAEVNSLLGEPEPAAPVEEPTVDKYAIPPLLRLNAKYLSSEDEFTRRFGRDEEEPRSRRRTNIHTKLTRQIKLPQDTYQFSVSGLSMELIDEVCGVKSFKFLHSQTYRLKVRDLILAVEQRWKTNGPLTYEEYNMNTVEAVIEDVDRYFLLDQIIPARKTMEAAIYFMQKITCPAFNFCDGKTRLDYAFVENRPFHLLLLKYMYLLSTAACHRTALEVAKSLLNLDPSDPLAVIYIMDTMALRAREFQWLADLYVQWGHERHANKLFNVQYSHALARYNLYLKTKKPEDLVVADKYLREAMVNFPSVVVMLLKHCNKRCPEVTSHPLYTVQQILTTSDSLRRLQKIYTALAGSWWREGNIPTWLADNAFTLCTEYDNDPETKKYVLEAEKQRSLLFKDNPVEIDRHLRVIKPMLNLIMEDSANVAPPANDTFAFNPYPHSDRCVDEYAYFTVPSGPQRAWGSFSNVMMPANFY